MATFMEIVIGAMGAWMYAGSLKRLWSVRGWLPRLLFLAGGVFLLLGALRSHGWLVVLGVMSLLLARQVPAHGVRRTPGYG